LKRGANRGLVDPRSDGYQGGKYRGKFWHFGNSGNPGVTNIGTKLPHQKLETVGYHTVKTRSVYLTWA